MVIIINLILAVDPFNVIFQGNIRVFCRVRPLLGDETLGNDGIIPHMNFPDHEQKTLELDKTGDATLNEVRSTTTEINFETE